MSDIGKKIKTAGSTIVNPNIHIMKNHQIIVKVQTYIQLIILII